MSYQDYEEAAKLIDANAELRHFVGERPKSLISKAEQALDLQFPASYRDYLLRYGAGSFGAEEIYGVIGDDFEHSSVPDAIWYTLGERSKYRLPVHLVVIYDTGGEETFCLDFSKMNEHNEPAVVAYATGVDPEYQEYEVIAEDFGEFLLNRVKREVLAA